MHAICGPVPIYEFQIPECERLKAIMIELTMDVSIAIWEEKNCYNMK
jgi:hypothetical protein